MIAIVVGMTAADTVATAMAMIAVTVVTMATDDPATVARLMAAMIGVDSAAVGIPIAATDYCGPKIQWTEPTKPGQCHQVD